MTAGVVSLNQPVRPEAAEYGALKFTLSHLPDWGAGEGVSRQAFLLPVRMGRDCSTASAPSECTLEGCSRLLTTEIGSHWVPCCFRSEPSMQCTLETWRQILSLTEIGNGTTPG